MGLKDELVNFCGDVITSKWETTEGRVVPDENSRLTLKNTAITIEGTVLYSDLDGSTAMVDGFKNWFAAEIYKSYLYCCARIISAHDGVVSAYDGDRVMAVFIGGSKNTNAAKAALKIKWAVDNIIMPKVRARYPNTKFELKHVTGIDTCPLFVAKTGARGANDLVWVGRAANYAAKLTSLPSTYTYVTESVYKMLNKEVKVSTDGRAMWQAVTWNTFNNQTIYRSEWGWVID